MYVLSVLLRTVTTGHELEVKLIRDRHRGIVAGYGFIDFRSHDTAQLVLDTLNGKPIGTCANLFLQSIVLWALAYPYGMRGRGRGWGRTDVCNMRSYALEANSSPLPLPCSYRGSGLYSMGAERLLPLASFSCFVRTENIVVFCSRFAHAFVLITSCVSGSRRGHLSTLQTELGRGRQAYRTTPRVLFVCWRPLAGSDRRRVEVYVP